MDAGTHTFTCQQGDTFERVLELHQNSFEGATLPLDGFTARMQIRDGIAGEVALELSTEAESIEIEAEEGRIRLILEPAATATLSVDCDPGIFPPVKNYVYDLEITNPDGVVTTILRGYFSVIGGVTR
ncbi:MAG: hypothetical protein IPK59_10240 [Rhodospirillaceae bacterium]|nr:hypothetical protein [Rhodospirillaceae bacterium]